MLNFSCFFPKFRKFCQKFAEFSPNLTKIFRDFSKMQEQQEKIPNGQRGADSAGPTARGRQRRAGPVWPISARSSARPLARPLSATCPSSFLRPPRPRKRRRLRLHSSPFSLETSTALHFPMSSLLKTQVLRGPFKSERR